MRKQRKDTKRIERVPAPSYRTLPSVSQLVERLVNLDKQLAAVDRVASLVVEANKAVALLKSVEADACPGKARRANRVRRAFNFKSVFLFVSLISYPSYIWASFGQQDVVSPGKTA